MQSTHRWPFKAIKGAYCIIQVLLFGVNVDHPQRHNLSVKRIILNVWKAHLLLTTSLFQEMECECII